MVKPRLFNKLELINEPGLIMIGNFDGVHLGHQQILQEAKNITTAQNFKFNLLTFNPHPQVYLKNKNLEHHYLLSSYEDKNEELFKLGVDTIIELEFNKSIQELDGEKFLDLLFSNENINGIIIGYDTVIGVDRVFGPEQIEKYCQNKQKQFFKLEKYQFNNELVNSTLIRGYLENGEIKEANKLIGRKFSILGEVKKFKELGKTQNAATANFNYPYYQKVPRLGVYFTNCIFDQKVYPAISNIGKNPTIDQLEEVRIESHLLINEEINLYNKQIKIELLEFLREEKKFDSPTELFAQIKVDIELARSFHGLK